MGRLIGYRRGWVLILLFLFPLSIIIAHPRYSDTYLYAQLSDSVIVQGDSCKLHAWFYDKEDNYENVHFFITLPNGLSTDQFDVFLGTGVTNFGEAYFTIYGNRPGNYTLYAHMEADNFPNDAWTVLLFMKVLPPIPETITITTTKTSFFASPYTTRLTITEKASFVSGFGWFPVLMVMAILGGLRRRRA